MKRLALRSCTKRNIIYNLLALQESSIIWTRNLLQVQSWCWFCYTFDSFSFPFHNIQFLSLYFISDWVWHINLISKTFFWHMKRINCNITFGHNLYYNNLSNIWWHIKVGQTIAGDTASFYKWLTDWLSESSQLFC